MLHNFCTKTLLLFFRLPPGYPRKKAARFFMPDGFLRNVIALIKFFCGCRLRKALILQCSYKNSIIRNMVTVNTQGQIILGNPEVRQNYVFIIFVKRWATRCCEAVPQARHGRRATKGRRKYENKSCNICCRRKVKPAVADAPLQKTYTVSVLDKKRSVNDGAIPKYYVEGCHEAIIDRETFLLVQKEIARRSSLYKGGKKHASTVQNTLLQETLSALTVATSTGGLYGPSETKSPRYGGVSAGLQPDRNVPSGQCRRKTCTLRLHQP